MPSNGYLNMIRKLTMKPTRVTIALTAVLFGALMALTSSVRIEMANVTTAVGFIGVASIAVLAALDYRLMGRHLTNK